MVGEIPEHAIPDVAKLLKKRIGFLPMQPVVPGSSSIVIAIAHSGAGALTGANIQANIVSEGSGMRRLLILLVFATSLEAATKDDAAAEANAALALARAGKYELAIPRYRAAIALDPGLPGIHLNLGLAYFKLNRFSEAASSLKRAAKADPANFQVRALLGMSYYGSRRFDAAAAELQRAAGQQPDNIELRFKLAQSYLWSGQYEAAKNQFKFLLEKNPDSAPVHMLLGEVLDAGRQNEQAITEFEAAVRASPDEPEVHFGLGYLYWKQGRYDDARREFQTELANQPQHVQALTYLGDAEMHIGNRPQATDYLKRALKADPNARLAHLDLGILLTGTDPQNAATCFREAIRLDPARPDAHYRLGQLLLSMGREQEADAEFAKVKELGDKKESPAPLVKLAPSTSGPKQ